MTPAAILERLATPHAHAFLLSGPRGVGKRTLAKTLASRWLEIEEERLFTHPDIVWLDVRDLPSGTSVIEEVRTFLERLRLTTVFSRRVGVLIGLESLSFQAQNALLKTLEEPTPGNILLLLTDGTEQVLATIRSRVVTLPITPPHIQSVVAEFGEEVAVYARGLPEHAASIAAEQGSRERAAEVVAECAAFLNASLPERLVIAGKWTREQKKKEEGLTFLDRLPVLEGVARHLATQNHSSAAALLAALPKAYAALSANANTQLTAEDLAMSLPDA